MYAPGPSSSFQSTREWESKRRGVRGEEERRRNEREMGRGGEMRGSERESRRGGEMRGSERERRRGGEMRGSERRGGEEEK